MTFSTRVMVSAAAALLIGAGCGLGVQAQTVAQTVPAPLPPGSIERQFQPPPQPRARPGTIELPGELQAAPAGAESARFGVRRIALQGASNLPADVARALIAPHEGREISLAELFTLAQKLTATYRNEGYILAQVLVPEQRIEPQDAVVRLQAVEGYIDEVRFSGDVALREGADPQRLDAVAAAIRAARPITAATLERYLLLLNDIPGLGAATTLTPSRSQAGAADLEVRLTQRSVGGELVIDNRGSRAVGSWRATAEVEAFGLVGASRSSIKLASSHDKRLLFASLLHEQVVSDEGTRLVLSAGGARARPGATASLDLQTTSRSLGLAVQHPLLRSRAENLYLRAAFTGYDGQTRVNDSTTSEDRVRAARIGLTWDLADAYRGLNIVDLELAHGLGRFGATARDSLEKSRAAGRPDFTKGTFYAARLQSVARRWSVLAAAQAQFAMSDLLAPELFAVGGEQFGRGYEPSEIVGDHGAAIKLELRYTATGVSGAAADWLPSSYTLYAFYDAGVVRRRSPVNESTQASLASAGVGLRFGDERRLSGFLEVAQPLTRLVASRGDRDARSYAGMAAKF